MEQLVIETVWNWNKLYSVIQIVRQTINIFTSCEKYQNEINIMSMSALSQQLNLLQDAQNSRISK